MKISFSPKIVLDYIIVRHINTHTHIHCKCIALSIFRCTSIYDTILNTVLWNTNYLIKAHLDQEIFVRAMYNWSQILLCRVVMEKVHDQPSVRDCCRGRIQDQKNYCIVQFGQVLVTMSTHNQYTNLTFECNGNVEMIFSLQCSINNEIIM